MNKEQTVNYYELFKTINIKILDRNHKIMCLHLQQIFEERFKHFKIDTS